MAPHLIARGIPVTVVAEDCAENRAAIEAIPGIEPAFFPAGLSMLAERRAKEERLQHADADLVQICGLGWRNALNRSGIRGTFLMDHVELESSILTNTQLRRWMQRWLERWSFLHYDGSLAASRYLEHEIRRNLLRKSCGRPILYLPFAFEQGVSAPDPHRVAARRSSARGRKTISYMGGLHCAYGVRKLIAAYRSSLDLCRSTRLLFFGKGPESEFIASQPKGQDDGAWIEYAGFLSEPDLMECLFASDVLVSPLNNTVQDWARCPSKTYVYMATRRPIVTAPVGENLEVLAELGYYYDPSSDDSLVSALIRALTLESEMPYKLESHTWSVRTEMFIQWVEKEFSWEVPPLIQS